MFFNRVRTLLVRKRRARELGVSFQRSASFELPERIWLAGQWWPLSVPEENGVRVAFVDILLDDCYGLRRLESPGSIVDIGAHVGLFGLAVRRLFPHAQLHAYEPNPRLEQYLKVQARTGSFRYWMSAVGACPGRVSLDYHVDSVRTQSRPDGSGDIVQIALSEVVERAGGTIDFLKLDCEGAEWRLFEDHSSWKHVNNLGMEYHLWPDHSHDEVAQVIRNLGLSVVSQKRSAEHFGLLWASR
jgi:FkbM family methyltransferase